MARASRTFLIVSIMMSMLSPASLSPSLNPLRPIVDERTNPPKAYNSDETRSTGACRKVPTESGKEGGGDGELSRNSMAPIVDARNKLKDRQKFLSCMEAGKRAVEKDDLHAALEHFSEACNVNPAAAESQNNLGNVLLELGEVERAMECYSRALQESPGLFNAHFNLATIWHAKATKVRTEEGKWGPESLGHWKKARRSYLEALACSPHNQDCLYNLANLYSERGFSRQAFELYGKSAIVDDSIDSENLVNMGVAAFKSGHFQAAEQCFRRAIYNDPKCEQATINLALCIVGRGLQKWHMGKAKDAIVAFHECAALVSADSKGSHTIPRYLAWSCACAVAIGWSEQKNQDATSTDWILDRTFEALGVDRESGVGNDKESLDVALLLFVSGMKEESRAVLRKSKGVARDRQAREFSIAALSFWGRLGPLIEHFDKANLRRSLNFCEKDDMLHPMGILSGGMDYRSLVMVLDILHDLQAAPDCIIRGWLLQKADPFARPITKYLKTLEPSKLGRELLGGTEYVVKGTIFGDMPPHHNLTRARRVTIFAVVVQGRGWYIFDEGFVLRDENVRISQIHNLLRGNGNGEGGALLEQGAGPGWEEEEESEEMRVIKNIEAAEGNAADVIDLASNSFKDSWSHVWGMMRQQVEEVRKSMRLYSKDAEDAERSDFPLQLLQFQFEVAQLQAPPDQSSSPLGSSSDPPQELQVKLHDVINGVEWEGLYNALPMEQRDVADALVYDAVMLLILGNEFSSTHFLRMPVTPATETS